ncbi:MAG: SMI1/KNR4 family protein [Ruminococcus sp.]|nr:SMI1/KNR4 family protein [Ruminococcus sp.]
MKIFDKLFGSRKTADKNPVISPETPVKIKPENTSAQLKEIFPKLPENFAVTDTESAKQFFMACEGSFKTMTGNYPEEMYEAFTSITDHKTRYAFTKEFALKKFDSILNSEVDNITVTYQVYDVISYWGMDYYDKEFIDKLTALAKFSNERSPRATDIYSNEYQIQLRHDVWLKNYLNHYNNRGKIILKVQPLVEMTYDYLMKKYPDKYEYNIGEVIRLCRTLKSFILEETAPDESLNMEFSLADDRDTDSILNEFSSLSNGNPGRIKGMIRELNCIYGIRTPDFFITAASDDVDSGSERTWATFRFASVFYNENTTAVFVCSRSDDCLFYPERKYKEQYPILEKYQESLAQAILLYRNRKASDTFIKDLEKSISNYNFINELCEKQKELCKRYGDSFSYMRERITDQSISETLSELIDCCEEISPTLGIDQTTFHDSASEQDIRQCEERNGINIPIQLREFLMFSNGATLFENSTSIYSTSEIGKFTLDGYDDENAKIYIPIGDFIGDGTMFVLNKTNGETGEYDHETGEVEIFGYFDDLLAWIIDFHCSDYMN